MLRSVFSEYTRLTKIAYYRARIESIGREREKLREKQMGLKQKMVAQIREEGKSGVVLLPQGFEVQR